MNMEALQGYLSNSLAVLIPLAVAGAFFLVRLFFDFVKSDVLPRIYESRLKRLQIVVPYAEKVLAPDVKTPLFFRDGGPRFIDFQEGYIFRRPEVESVRDVLNRLRFVHLEGVPSSGKTVIALNLAHDAILEGATPLYFKRPSTLSTDLLEYLKSPEGYERFDRKNALFILDDVHLDIPAATELLTFVVGNYKQLKLLFVSRPLNQLHEDMGSEWHFEIGSYMQSMEIKPDQVVSHLANDYSLRRYQKRIPASVLAAFQDECGSDLLLLGRYLRVWNGEPLIHLPNIREQVYESVRADLSSLSQFSSDSVELLLLVCLFYRFEIRVERRFLENQEMDVVGLIRSGDLLEENGFILLHHSSLAKLYSNVIESSDMPAFDALCAKYSSLPVGLFEAYIQSGPRNVCEFFTGLRFTRTLVPQLLQNRSNQEAIRSGLLRERDANLLSWAMLILYSSSRDHGWELLESLDFSKLRPDFSRSSAGDDLSGFLMNLHRISKTKGAEWFEGVELSGIASAISEMPFDRSARSLYALKSFSEKRLDELVEHLSPEAICNSLVREQDISKLKSGVARYAALMGARVCVKSTTKKDFVGDWTSRLTFYFGTHRVTRFIGGRHRFPYATAKEGNRNYFIFLLSQKIVGASITIDDGANIALKRRRSVSLWPAGVMEVEGSFQKQDVVEIAAPGGEIIGFGVTNFSSEELRIIKGLRSSAIETETNIVPNRVMDNDMFVSGQRYLSIYNEYNQPVTTPS